MLAVLAVTTAPVLTVNTVELIVSKLVYALLERKVKVPLVVPPLLTSKYIVLAPLVRSRMAASLGTDNATLLIALSPALNAVAALLVTPVSVPTLVRLLVTTVDFNVSPVSVPAAAVIVIAALPSKSTPLMARAVANLVAVLALPVSVPTRLPLIVTVLVPNVEPMLTKVVDGAALPVPMLTVLVVLNACACVEILNVLLLPVLPVNPKLTVLARPNAVTEVGVANKVNELLAPSTLVKPANVVELDPNAIAVVPIVVEPPVIVIAPSASLAVVIPPPPMNLIVSSLSIVRIVLSSAATLNVNGAGVFVIAFHGVRFQIVGNGSALVIVKLSPRVTVPVQLEVRIRFQ
jgi:hypothetical protein